MNEPTVSDSEALLLAYVRYIDKGKFAKEMLFCESLETTTTATDICNKLKHYLDQGWPTCGACATSGSLEG